MKPLTHAFLVAALCAATAVAGAQKLDRAPYLQNMRPDSVEILWRTDVPTETWVEVREAAGGKARRWNSNVPVTAHQIRVPALKPDTAYLYRVGTGPGRFLTRKPIPFQTFPAGDVSSFSFLAYGDHRNYPKDHRAVVDAILTQTRTRGWPRFILDSGDYTGQGEHKTDFWNEQFFDPERGLMDRVCLFPQIGNHEAPDRQPRIPLRYLENFSVPTENSGTEYYYSFDFGSAHFCMIDAYSTEFTTGTKQYAWIARDLKTTKKPWKFAVLHYPVFIHRSAPSVTYGNMAIRENLVPLFEKSGVSAVISGDSHFYQRSEVNGIQYICSGGGGAPLYTPGNGKDYVRASKKVHHYAWITVEGDRMKLEVFDTSNTLIDTMTTGCRAPAASAAGPPLNFRPRMPDAQWTSGTVTVIESRTADGGVTSAPAYAEAGDEFMSSSVKSTVPGLSAQGSRFSGNAETNGRTCFTPSLPGPGTYLVSVTVPAAPTADAPTTLFEVRSPGAELIRGRVALSASAAGNKWADIGLFDLAPGASLTFLESEDQVDRFYSDAVRFVKMTRNEKTARRD